MFRKPVLLPSSGKNVSNLVEPFRKAQRLRVALRKVFNRLCAFISMQKEAQHVAETSRFIKIRRLSQSKERGLLQ